MAVDIRKAEIAAGVVVGETLVVEPELMKQRGVEIVDVHRFLDGTEAEFVGGAVDVAALHSAAGEPGGEAEMVVVAAFHRPR